MLILNQYWTGSKTNPDIMADQKIVEYVKTNLEKGLKVEEIKKALKESGWPDEEINKGVLEASFTPTQPSISDVPAAPVTQTQKPDHC